MSLLNELTIDEVWQKFYEYKKEKAHLSKLEDAALKSFIEEKNYYEAAKKIISDGFCFEPPVKKLINKTGTNKKRAVYFFKEEENYILKLISHLLYKYDDFFPPNLYSFRKNFGVKRALHNFIKLKNISKYNCYKLDIKNYFNSIDIDLLLPKLNEVFKDDIKLFEFFENMLKADECVFLENKLTEKRGVMAGTPTSPFLSNLFLAELDRYFFNLNVPYARYSDDIIVFAPTVSELFGHKKYIKNFLNAHNLNINEEKEQILSPGEPWSFLGIQYCGGVIDLSPVTIQKIKDKIKRKAKSIYRWKNKRKVPNDKALTVMTRHFNRKFFENGNPNDLNWSRWFFPLLTTDKGLKEVDEYMQMYLRFLVTGKHNKLNYKKASYELLKSSGYISLVNKYYKYKNYISADTGGSRQGALGAN